MLTKASYILTAVLEVVENSRPSLAKADRSRKFEGKFDMVDSCKMRVMNLVSQSIEFVTSIFVSLKHYAFCH